MLRIGTAAINQIPLDWEGNLTRILNTINETESKNISVLFFPELCISGYGCEDMFLSQTTLDESLKSLKTIFDRSSKLIIGVGLPIQFNNDIYNAYCLIKNKEILGFYIKPQPFNSELYYEGRWFKNWRKGDIFNINIESLGINEAPIGDLEFNIHGKPIKIDWSLGIHEDTTFQSDSLVVNPLAVPFSFLNYQKRKENIRKLSKQLGFTYIETNLLGNEAGKIIYDGGTYIISNGEVKSSARRFDFNDYTISWTDVAVSADRQIEDKTQKSSGVNTETYEESESLKEEEFSRATSLALFDYLRKSYSQGYMISLSGGADSAACLVICSLMTKYAVSSIGLNEVKKKLSHIETIQSTDSSDSMASQLIATIYQATANSSDTTFQAAQALAHQCKAKFYHIDVEKIVAGYTQIIEEQLDRKLSWETDDLALQNIQARVRAPGVWMLTNIKNFLLLTTSNRSEVSVGYSTMDGDTAGSIAPISGVNKSWLKDYLIWLEKTGCSIANTKVKYEALSHINVLAPTAELRPHEADQTDEKDLMPYPILNRIENLFVREKNSPLESYQELLKTESSYQKTDLAKWVVRFYTMWSRSQWKRERLAIGFHLDNYNLDPNGWIRFPVISQAFNREIAELRKIKAGL